jgi:hypothetical protein
MKLQHSCAASESGECRAGRERAVRLCIIPSSRLQCPGPSSVLTPAAHACSPLHLEQRDERDSGFSLALFREKIHKKGGSGQRSLIATARDKGLNVA